MSLGTTPSPKIYVYQEIAGHPVDVRSTCAVGDDNRLSETFRVQKGELIAIDLRQPSQTPGSTNGPFLRLAEYNAGWLFEKKYGQQMFQEIPCDYGLRAYKVTNEVGIALRSRPAESHCMEPEVVYLSGTVLFTDVQVPAYVSGEFGNWLRVQGTGGWVFTRREYTSPMLQEITLEEAFSSVQAVGHVEGEEMRRYANDKLKDVSRVRTLATNLGLVELQHNTASKVISFTKQSGPGTDGGSVRINVYYSTGTVGTALLHPSQGATQLFRRDCSLDDLASIMENPRVHTDKGYQRRQKRARGENDADVHSSSRTSHTSVSTGAADVNEEKALRLSLHAFDIEFEELAKTRESIVERLAECQVARTKRAKLEAAQAARDAGAAKALLAQKKAEEARRLKMQAEDLARRKRGDKFLFELQTNLSKFRMNRDHLGITLGFNPTADGTDFCALAYNNNTAIHIGSIPKELALRLQGRADDHPKMVEATLGGFNQYFVRFENGKEHHYFQSKSLNEVADNHRINWVTLGMDNKQTPTYVVKYGAHGAFKWGNHGKLPGVLLNILKTRPAEVHRVTLGPQGEWFVSFHSGRIMYGGCKGKITGELNRLKREGKHVRHIEWGLNHTYVLRYSDYSGPFFIPEFGANH